MILLRILATMFIGMGGAILGIEVAQSTCAAWWIGVATVGLVILIVEGT